MFKALSSFFYNSAYRSIAPSLDYYCNLLAPVHSTSTIDGDEIRLRRLENHAFLAADGSLVSFVSVEGMFGVNSESRRARSHEMIEKALDVLHEEGGGFLEWTFQSNGNDAKRLLDAKFEAIVKHGRGKGILVDDYVASEKKALLPRIRPRKCIIAIWTPFTVLSQPQREEHEKVIQAFFEKRMKDVESVSQAFVQSSTTLNQTLEQLHDTRVDNFIYGFTQAKAKVGLLDWHEALRSIKETIEPSSRFDGWRPYLPGDAVPPRNLNLNECPEPILADVAPISLGWQLLDKKPELDGDFIKYNGLWHAPKAFMLGPDKFDSIETLAAKLPLNLPWRIRVVASPLYGLGPLKKSLAYMSAVTRIETNMLHKNSIQELDLRLGEKRKLFSLQIVIDTWAKTQDQVKTQQIELEQELLRWGNPKLTSDSGTVRTLFISSLPGMTLKVPAPKHFMDAQEASMFFPGAVPANLLSTGSEYFLSEGQLLNAGLMAPELNRYIGAIIGRSGSGKSMLLNSSKLNKICQEPKSMPFMTLLDVNASAKGVKNFVDARSEGKLSHLVVYHKLSRNKHGAYNPLDLRLGMRHPLPLDIDNLSDFLTIYVSSIDQGVPYPGMREMIKDILVNAYTLKSTEEYAERYQPGEDLEVDEVLSNYTDFYDLSRSKQYLTWFEVVDFLSANEDYLTAAKANRFTSPLITDLPMLYKSNQAKFARFGQRLAPDGNKLFDVFEQMVQSNKSEYECFSYRTRVSFDHARIVILDLADVTPANDPKMSKMMYGLALFMGAKNYPLCDPSVTDTILENWPVMYRRHWARLLQEMRDVPRIIEGDEIHRTGKPSIIQNGIETPNPFWALLNRYAAELRKSYGGMLLSSQEIGHFSKEYLSTHCSVHYLGGDWPENQARVAKEVLGLDDEEGKVLARDVHGVRAGLGSKWMVRLEVEGSWESFVGYYVKGAEVLWMLTTTSQDNTLLSRLTELTGSAEIAQKVLMLRFPGGSAKKWFDDLKTQPDLPLEANEDFPRYACTVLLEAYKVGISTERMIA